MNIKKINFLTLFVISIFYLSCTSELEDETTSTIQNEKKVTEISNFTYKNKTYTITFERDEDSGEYNPIENDSFKFLNDVNEKNELLITYVIDDKNYILFENNENLLSYINKKSLSSKEQKYSKSTSIGDPYLHIYADASYSNNIIWTYSPNPYNTLPNIESFCSFTNGSDIDRLKNFNNSSIWTVTGTIPVPYDNSGTCPGNDFINNNPNDKVSSIKVYGYLARCYENSNYGGRSFVLDGRINETGKYNLKKVKRASWGRNWNDKISSIKLSN